jgi:uncharacterized protein (TIGR00725 family)
MAQQRWIGVIGPGNPDAGTYDLDALYALAAEVGSGLAEQGAVVLTGGLSGVMEGASYGASRHLEGEAWGVLPSDDPSTGNKYLTRRIATGVGQARNFVLVAMSDALIAIGESPGTRIEIGYAQVQGKLVVGLGQSTETPLLGIVPVVDAAEAVRMALDAAERRLAGT